MWAAGCQVDVAARGWDHDAWSGPYYPADLPREWRLSYYANDFRAALVPGEQLAAADSKDFLAWAEDTHTDFRFYLEVNDSVNRRAVRESDGRAFLDALAAIRDRVGGILLHCPGESAYQANALWTSALGRHCGLNVLCGKGGGSASLPIGWPGGDRSLKRQCWYPGVEGRERMPRGCMGYVREPPADLRVLRGYLEAFMGFAGHCKRGGLCFGGSPPAVDVLKSARVIAELLGG